jgi:putative spermidine/putrescine transport system permease protein
MLWWSNRVLSGSGGKALMLAPLALLSLGVGVPIAAALVRAVNELGFSGVFTRPLDDASFRRSILTTVGLAALTTTISITLGVIYALAIATASARWSAVLIALLLVAFWTSVLVRTYGWLLALEPNGTLDYLAKKARLTSSSLGFFQTLPGLVLPMVHVMLPYMVLPVYAAIRNLDPAQLRAARSLGGSPTLVLRRVVFPSIRAGVAAGGVIVFVLSLGFYVVPAFLGSPRDQVVAQVIADVFGRGQADLPLAAAMGVLLLILVLAVYFVADRFLRISEQWERA